MGFLPLLLLFLALLLGGKGSSNDRGNLPNNFGPSEQDQSNQSQGGGISASPDTPDTQPVTEIPTPALLPGLIGLGLALRNKRSQTQALAPTTEPPTSNPDDHSTEG